MRASTTLLALAASVASAQYLNQSAPFYLTVISTNSSLNGSVLSSCHEGAAIEGLCVSPPPVNLTAISSYSTYNFNYSAAQTPDPVLGYEGYLTWVLVGGNFVLSSPLTLSYNPTSDIAAPLLTPSESGQQVGFDNNDLLYIPGYEDDTVSPIKYTGVKAYYRWFVCETNFGYFYTTLAWVVGVHTHPQNPTCQAVSVKRVFV